jgi:uncharacterized membrane protein HdeD (DUF308 family)
MTQPYTPPPYPVQYQMPTDPRAPFKRASLLMFVMAAMTLLLSGCFGLMSRITLEQFPPESRQQMEKIYPDITNEAVQTGMLTLMALTFAPGVLLVITGVGVRTAKQGWVVTSLIIVGLMTAIMGLWLLLTLVQVVRNPATICGVFLVAVPTTLFVLLFVWLIGCYKAVDRLKATGNWQQQQYPGHAPYPYPQQTPYPPSGYGSGYPSGPPAQPMQQPPPLPGPIDPDDNRPR